MKYRGGTPVIARDFAAKHASLKDKSLTELADWYGVSAGVMRSALRMAEPILARKGLVVCVPMRATGYVVVITNDALTYLESVLTRVVPIGTEIGRWVTSHRVVEDDPLFEDLAEALDDIADRISERLMGATA